MDWLYKNWWGHVEPVNLPEGCDRAAIVSLKPGEQLEDSIVDTYCTLLYNRERELFGHDGCGAVKYYFLSPWFFQLMGSFHLKNMTKNPFKRKGKEWTAIDKDFTSYGTKENGAIKVTDFDYIIMPVATGGHWILFLWSIKDFRVSLFDPLRDNAPFMGLKEIYKEEFYVVVYFIFFFSISSRQFMLLFNDNSCLFDRKNWCH